MERTKNISTANGTKTVMNVRENQNFMLNSADYDSINILEYILKQYGRESNLT